MATTKLNLEFIRETDKARLFRRKNGTEIWIPRSVCPRVTKLAKQDGKPQVFMIEVENWFARQEGLS